MAHVTDRVFSVAKVEDLSLWFVVEGIEGSETKDRERAGEKTDWIWNGARLIGEAREGESGISVSGLSCLDTDAGLAPVPPLCVVPVREHVNSAISLIFNLTTA